jgi:hypothetical protein
MKLKPTAILQDEKVNNRYSHVVKLERVHSLSNWWLVGGFQSKGPQNARSLTVEESIHSEARKCDFLGSNAAALRPLLQGRSVWGGWVEMLKSTGGWHNFRIGVWDTDAEKSEMSLHRPFQGLLERPLSRLLLFHDVS